MSKNSTGIVSLFLKGATMGIANAIPGVSGGTIAFVTGIYETLINSIKSFDLKAVGLLKRLQIKSFLDHVNIWFLAPLGAGVLFGIVGFAYALKELFESHETYVWSFFCNCSGRSSTKNPGFLLD
jgi:putative membrane protein